MEHGSTSLLCVCISQNTMDFFMNQGFYPRMTRKSIKQVVLKCLSAQNCLLVHKGQDALHSAVALAEVMKN